MLAGSIDESAVFERTKHSEYDALGEAASADDFVETKRVGTWDELENLKRADDRSTQVAVAVTSRRLEVGHEITVLTGAGFSAATAGQQGIAQKVRRTLN